MNDGLWNSLSSRGGGRTASSTADAGDAVFSCTITMDGMPAAQGFSAQMPVEGTLGAEQV